MQTTEKQAKGKCPITRYGCHPDTCRFWIKETAWDEDIQEYVFTGRGECKPEF